MTLPDPDSPLDPARFVGRREVLETLSQRLRQREFSSSQVVGGPRTGKTSLLRYLESDRADALLAEAKGSLRVYVDARALGTQATPLMFWRKVCRELEASVVRANVAASLRRSVELARTRVETGHFDNFDLEDLFDVFSREHRPVVVLADEIDSVVSSASFLPPAEFFNQIRSLNQRVPRGLAFIVTSLRPLGDIVGTSAGPSPFYNHFGNVPLGTLGREDIGELIRQRVAGAPSNAVDDVLAYSAGHPYLVSHVLRHWQPPGTLAESLDALVADAEGPFVRLNQEILTVLSPHERQAVTTALDAPQMLLAGQRATLARLRKYSLLPPALMEVAV